MTSTEVTAWMAYERMAGPIGPARGDLHAGIIAATIANSNRGKGGRRMTPDDFIPQWDRKRQMTWQEQLAKVRELNRALGGAVRTKGGDRGGSVEPVGADRRRRRAGRPRS